jgi:hypothetical protein
MKQIIEKLKEQIAYRSYADNTDNEAGVILNMTKSEARQIVEALEGKEVDCDCTEPEGFSHGTVCPKCNRLFRITNTEMVGDRSMTNTIKAFDKFRSEYNRSVSNFNIDECIAAFYKKIENYASLDRKRLNEKMLKDLSAKELEDDVNRNKI